MLTEEMKSIIRTYPVGFVASVNADGTPNLSPKGTFVVLNDTQLAFGHIRSPGTIGNIAERPMIEVNFLDVLSRKAVRLRGRAKMFSKGAPEFGQALGSAFGLEGLYGIDESRGARRYRKSDAHPLARL
jgi:flavin reductase (DIM6/NTAB) family NADH-FMN oxidoreductase RutF